MNANSTAAEVSFGQGHASRSPRVAIIGCLFIAMLLAYSETVADMIVIWLTVNSFNHCILIPFIAIYVAWEKRERLAGLKLTTTPSALVFLLCNGMLWGVGELVSVAVLQHAALVGMAISSVWLMLGTLVCRAFLFPLLYLYFAVPEGQFLMPYLQDLTAEVLVVLLRATGIPVYLEGRHLAIPSGNFVVAEACSGINYLLAAVSVGSMYAYLNYRSGWRRAAFMLLTVIVPLVANGARAYAIVMIAHLSDYRYAMGVDHFVYGWVIFGIVIFALFALGNLFAEPAEASAAGGRENGLPAVTETRLSWLPVAAGVVVLLAPRASVALLDGARDAAAPIGLPAVEGWQVQPGSDRLGGSFIAADQSLHAVYRRGTNDETAVSLDLYFFSQQGPDREMVRHGNRIYGEDFRVMRFGIRSADTSAALARVNEVQLRRGSTDYLVWYWYEIAGRQAASGLGAKLAEAMGRITASTGGGVAIALSVAADDVAEGRQQLGEFVDRAQLTVAFLQQQAR